MGVLSQKMGVLSQKSPKNGHFVPKKSPQKSAGKRLEKFLSQKIKNCPRKKRGLGQF